MAASKGKIRIIGGEWRSRIVTFPNQIDLRPTPDRVRETVFNWLGQDLSGKTCLDLFAGSGVMGFESASRGAKQVVMVEADATTFKVLRANADQLQAMQVELKLMDAITFINIDARRFDVIFLIRLPVGIAAGIITFAGKASCGSGFGLCRERRIFGVR